MDTITNTSAVRAAILGTLVADASGMGLHWIYSQGKIAQVVQANNDVAEFLEPDRKNYEGVPSFFAHPLRSAGDGSNYGEYTLVLLRAISADGFDAAGYIRTFQEHFGPGGEYVGYADGPMRETVFNITRLAKEIEQRVLDVSVSLDEEKRESAAHFISRYFFEYEPEGLREQVRTLLKLQQWKKDELAELDRMLDAVADDAGAIGPDDDQMPALSRSAVLAHFYEGGELDAVVERAVRITNNNDTAVAYSRFFARIMRDIYTGETPVGDEGAYLRSLVERHLHLLAAPSQELVTQALGYESLDLRGATKSFGAACHVDMAVPLAIHILLRTDSFAAANRANIMASGDNCGRAVMLGPIAGALYGVGGERGIPEAWIDRTTSVAAAAKTPGGSLLLE